MFWKQKKSLLKYTIGGKPVTHWLNAFFPPLFWAGAIFVFSSQTALPAVGYSTLDFISKKTAHMIVYGVLFYLLNRTFTLTKKNYSIQTQWYLPFFICLLYAVSDETHQHFVPNRFASLRDVGYDTVGMLTAYLKVTKRI